MLYWAEGSKGRNAVQLVNADAGLLETFLTFLRVCYAVPDDAVTFSVNCFLGNGLTLEQIQHWWLATFIVQSIYGAIQEYAGIDRPEWLDL